MNGWYKPRKPISDYPETKQQQKVQVAGKAVGILCKGKKKGDFVRCRHEVLDCLFHGGACNTEVLDAIKTVEEQQRNQ